MNKFEFKDAEWEVTRFLNVPISTGILSNKTADRLQHIHIYGNRYAECGTYIFG